MGHAVGIDTDATPVPQRIRRSPPPFRRATVTAVAPITPRLSRVTLTGADLAGLVVTEPGASIRLLLPPTGADELVIPTWRGNEFLLPDDSKPAIRTFTPSLVAPDATSLVLDVVRHGRGVASEWVDRVQIGDDTAVSGPGRGYTVDPTASEYLIAGDESAIPAIRQLLAALPTTMPTHVIVETTDESARVTLPRSSAASLDWVSSTADAPPGTALADAVIATPLDPDARVWVAGEAAAVQRVRRFLFTEREFPRTRTTIRGYWKDGRAESASPEAGGDVERGLG
ncbi:MAG: siderophore-interacting protein [Acidimicrobiia bacterium]